MDLDRKLIISNQIIYTMKILLFMLFLELLSAAIVPNAVQNYKKILLSNETYAKCLDGSPSFLYFHQGTVKDKFIIFFQQGNICRGHTPQQALSECIKRSQTPLGSSDLRPEEAYYGGMLSTKKNNKFSEWSKVVFGYCDGSAYQGNREEPYEFQNTKLYFRGNANVQAMINWMIQNQKFKQASEVIVAGESVGGYGVAFWGPYIKNIVNTEKFYLISDGAVDVIFPPYIPEGEKQSKIDGSLQSVIIIQVSTDKDYYPFNKQCLEAFKGVEPACASIQYSYPFLDLPLLTLNSQYDFMAAQVFLGIYCVKIGVMSQSLLDCSPMQKMYLESFKKRKGEVIESIAAQGNNSAWYIGCSHHTYLSSDDVYDNENFRVPVLVGRTAKDAVQDFVNGEKFVSIDTLPWPNNFMCAY